MDNKTDNILKYFLDLPALINSETISTDIIRWGVNYALNSCYIGMNSGITKKIKDVRSTFNKKGVLAFSKIMGFFNFIFASFNRQLAARKYEIMIDDRDYSGNYSLVHIANSPYFAGRMTGLTDATPDDGVLDIALIKAAHPIKTLASIRRYSAGKCPKNCDIIQGKNITVRSTGKMWIQLDNEYIQDSEINLSVVHQAIQMVTPEGLGYPLGSISAI
jgi:diacylglycerol kinase family enzyme